MHRDTDPDAFLELVREVHATIFEDAYGHLAGCFRLPGERVWVGHNRHRFEGAPAESIESALRGLRSGAGSLADAPTDADRFSR